MIRHLLITMTIPAWAFMIIIGFKHFSYQAGFIFGGMAVFYYLAYLAMVIQEHMTISE